MITVWCVMREGEKGREKVDGFSVVGVINGCICANKLMKCQPCQLLSRYQMSNFFFFLHGDAVIVNGGQGRLKPADSV